MTDRTDRRERQTEHIKHTNRINRQIDRQNCLTERLKIRKDSQNIQSIQTE